MPEYKYFFTRRLTLNAMPKKGLQYIESFKAQKFVRCIKRLLWGYAVYNRPLTTEEVLFLEVIPAPGDDA